MIGEVDELTPLSSAQRRLWFLDQLDPNTPSYNTPQAMRLSGPLRVEALRQCFAHVIARHDALRMRVLLHDGAPVQTIAKGAVPELHYLSLEHLDADRPITLSRIAIEAARRVFDLARGPMLRIVVCRLSHQEWALVASAHHIATDGASNTLIMREVAYLYQSLVEGQPAALPELPTRYVDQVRRAEDREKSAAAEHTDFFVERLKEWPTILELATDGPRLAWADSPADRVAGRKVEVVVEGSELSSLEQLCRREHTTPFGLLFSAFAMLLGRYSGQQKFAIGVPVSLRDQVELESMVGFFVNVVPIAVDVTPAQTFRALLRQVRSDLLDAHAHREAPLDRIVQKLQAAREAGYAPLFQAICESAPPMSGRIGIPGLPGEPLPFDWDVARYDLTLSIRPEQGACRLLLVYRSPLFEEATARAMMSTLLAVLREAVERPQAKLEELGVARAAPVAERRPAGPQESASSVWELFDRAATAFPDRTAVHCEDRLLSFAMLRARAEQIAALLERRGVRAGDAVAVLLGHDLDHWPVCLGVMRMGAHCVPLDPRGAAARTAHILADSRARLVVTRGGAAALLGDAVHRIDLDELPFERSAACAAAAPSPERAAYALYTSGSTGEPKGVVVPQRALVHYCRAAAERLGFGGADRFFSFIPTSLDPSIGNSLAALTSGATLCIQRAPGELVGEDVFRLAAEQGLTVLDMSVAFWHEWVAATPQQPRAHAGSPLRLVMFGGESPSPEAFRSWRRLTGERGARIVTSYGPTECTVASSMVTASDPSQMERILQKKEIGTPLGAARLHVVDASFRPCSPGAPGEICVGGPNVAHGYAGRPDQTAARFVPDPFSGEPGARLYRTGDGGRVRPDGALEFRGRRDRQVKINGHRVELGEVEAVVASHPGVKSAAVVLFQRPGEPVQLVAYVVPHPERPSPAPGLRGFVRERLPAHMVPLHFVEVASIPRTESGKPLHRALVPPAAPEAADESAALDAEEAELAGVWRTVLGVPAVGRDQSFFALGGHSLLAIRLVAELRRHFGRDVSLRDVFERPTIREFLPVLRDRTKETAEPLEEAPAEATKEGRYAPFPLTEVQQAYWLGRTDLFKLGNVGAQGYQEYVVENLDPARLTRTVRALIDRHDMLRAVVGADGTQRVLEQVPPYEVRVHHLEDAAQGDAERELAKIRDEMSYRVFDPAQWPLFDVRLVQVAGGKTHVCASFDILIGDEWSFQIILRELAALYQHPEIAQAPLQLTFRDYVLTELGQRKTAAYQRSMQYWKARLSAFPGPPELPVLKTLDECRSPRFVCRKSTLDPARWSALSRRCQQVGVTPTALLLTVFTEVLGAWSTSEHFALMLTLFNRRPIHPQVDEIVGDFTALVPFESSERDEPTFTERVRKVQRQLWDDLDHSAYSGVQVLRDLNRGARKNQQALLPIVFTSTLHQQRSGADRAPSELGELFGRGVAGVSQTPQVLLDHGVREIDGSLVIYWNTVEEAFAPDVIGAMLEAELDRLIVLSDASTSWSEALPLALRPVPAIKGDLEPGPVAKETLYALFELQRKKDPDAIAVVSPERSLTYAELEDAAAEVDARLAGIGVAQGQIVAVVMEKRWEQIAAILGVLRRGAVYLPLDPAMAAPRLRYCVEHAGARAAIVSESLAALSDVSTLRAGGLVWSAARSDRAPPAATPSDALAYVIYTSGSTGDPKGVMIRHGAAVNTVLDINRRFGVGPGDRVLALSGIDFDLSVYDIFGLLAAGGGIVLPAPQSMRDPEAWASQMQRAHVTLWNTVPSLMSLLVGHLEDRAEPPRWSLRLALMSGDWIPVRLPDRLRALSPATRVISLGGATEASIWSIFHPVDVVDPSWSSIPYGKPLARQSVSVYDRRLNVRPPWVTGEIYIGGDGVAIGYLGDREKTERSFLLRPGTGERVYRTGDYGRYRPDGDIEFLGRRDQQVKVHGYRIELREVERAIESHPAVAAAAAAAVGDPRGEKTLVAYVVAKEDAAFAASELRAYLRGKLPEYMVPVRFLPLPALPLTANGKVDRKALPDPTIERAAPPAERVSLTPLQERVLAICAETLGVSELGPQDNFFSLGGDSLIAIRLSLRLREELRADLPLRSLFQAETLGELADQVETNLAAGKQPLEATSDVAHSRRTTATPIAADPAARHLPFALTDIQEAFWVGRLGAFELGNVSTHVYWEFEFQEWSPAQANKALARLIERHDMLRAVILPDGRQRVLESLPPYELEVLDLRSATGREVESALAASRAEMSHRVHQLDRWPLFELRAHLLPSGAARVHVGLDMIIADALSLMTLQRDFSRLYAEQEALAPLTLTYRDCVVAQRRLRETPVYQASKAYWQERVASLPPAPELPYVNDPAALEAPRFTTLAGQLPAQTWARLRARGAKVGLTSGVLLCAAFAEAVRRFSAAPRFTLNLPLYNRPFDHAEVSDVVGPFTSNLLLAVEHAPHTSFETRARTLMRQLWDDLDHRHFGGVEVLREYARASGDSRRALMPVVFNNVIVRDIIGADFKADTMDAAVVYASGQTSQVLLDCTVAEHQGALQFTFGAVEGAFAPGVLEALFQAYARILELLSADEAAWTGESFTLDAPAAPEPILPDDPGPEPAFDLVDELVVKQLRANPLRAAVVTAERTLTFAELDRLSLAVADWLRERGAAPDMPVAVAMEKGWEPIVAVLGVLRAGAAFLPIDPSLPAARVDKLLSRGQVSLGLTQTRLTGGLSSASAIAWLAVDGLRDQAPRSTRPPMARSGSDLAYVIFTSGSTGEPKGVMVEHRALATVLADTNRRFGIGADDRVLAVAPLSFDMSVYDTLGVLAAGGTVVMPEAARARDPKHWVELLSKERITIWNGAPQLMTLLLETLEEQHQRSVPQLRYAFLGGDFIPLTMPERLRRVAPGATVVSVGGPTETTLWNIFYRVAAVDPSWSSIPYGKPFSQQKYYVLNEALESCPPWVRGKLYCAGRGVARGYWRDAEKTAARFIVHPRTGERLYDTGDLGRLCAGGNIEILGREDAQLKINGYRVEPGEIEAALLKHPALEQAVVQGVKDEGGQKKLVAHLVLARAAGQGEHDWRAFLRDTLPEYMVPARFLVADSIPATFNGKVDYRALAALAERSIARVPQAPAASALLSRLGQILAEVIGVEAIEPHQDLLSLGASSVDIIRASNRLRRELGWAPDLRSFFEDSTLESLARQYEAWSAIRGEAAPANGASEARAPGQLIDDPEERKQFRKRRLGIRSFGSDRERVLLEPRAAERWAKDRYLARRSRRKLANGPVPLDSLSSLLAHLGAVPFDGEPRYLYGSPGGLYPVQVYVHAKKGGVRGLDAGTYYYHPGDHSLVLLQPGAELDASVHALENLNLAAQASFTIFFVAEMKAIEPVYGGKSRDYALLQAGLMAQLLEENARAAGIGVCQVGWLDFDRLRGSFDLASHHQFLHAMVGGGLEEAEAADFLRKKANGGDSQARVRSGSDLFSLRQQIDSLTPEDLERLLRELSADEDEARR